MQSGAGAEAQGIAAGDITFEARGSKEQVEQGSHFQPLFDEKGLIPVIVCDATNERVLMFAWMNQDALRLTLATGDAHFYSRSRAKLWRKGEDSGNTLSVRDIATDCDQDVLLLRVDVNGGGVACHTGQRSCFYRRLEHVSQGIRLQPNSDAT